MRYAMRNAERGSALLVAVFAMILLVGTAAGIFFLTVSESRSHLFARERVQAFYVAEAGLGEAVAELRAGGDGIVGGPNMPVSFAGGSYWVQTAAGPGNTLVVVSDATLPSIRGTTVHHRRLEVVVQTTPEDSIYWYAVFAGNSSGDPMYNMKFGGSGAQADQINGDVYSGGNVLTAGTAAHAGTVDATGTITGWAGTTGVTRPVPDIPAMNYPVNHDVNVAQQLATFGTSTYWSKGGTARQVPSSNPAHMFRMNPSDRSSNWSPTQKNDYFLEDPYAFFGMGSSSDTTGTNAAQLTFATGYQDQKIYYVDGNLWLHNRYTYSFKFGAGTRVTIVARGNIYFSDNLFYTNAVADGVAFIAMKDAAVTGPEGSGNIYFGDPTFGTLRTMNSFLYAENDFKDNNMAADGSKIVTLNGNMTAGDLVDINRDYPPNHSKLTVNFDSRIKDGALTLPGLPTAGGGATSPSFTVVSWREVDLVP